MKLHKKIKNKFNSKKHSQKKNKTDSNRNEISNIISFNNFNIHKLYR